MEFRNKGKNSERIYYVWRMRYGRAKRERARSTPKIVNVRFTAATHKLRLKRCRRWHAMKMFSMWERGKSGERESVSESYRRWRRRRRRRWEQRKRWVLRYLCTQRTWFDCVRRFHCRWRRRWRHSQFTFYLIEIRRWCVASALCVLVRVRVYVIDFPQRHYISRILIFATRTWTWTWDILLFLWVLTVCIVLFISQSVIRAARETEKKKRKWKFCVAAECWSAASRVGSQFHYYYRPEQKQEATSPLLPVTRMVAWTKQQAASVAIVSACAPRSQLRMLRIRTWNEFRFVGFLAAARRKLSRCGASESAGEQVAARNKHISSGFLFLILYEMRKCSSIFNLDTFFFAAFECFVFVLFWCWWCWWCSQSGDRIAHLFLISATHKRL